MPRHRWMRDRDKTIFLLLVPFILLHISILLSFIALFHHFLLFLLYQTFLNLFLKPGIIVSYPLSKT
ncbi:hypothetical protein C8R41DRAFT_807353 [Lentinula lateritia]|uniref:Uncharacterized protein n=1 Tax=Lentinula lateritia TaxID=40482 RepID=A0ABQ8W2D1_9AGAR|nr:hypothetical protein C8R41DRAFT_807353 [Lentinula lateritia]